MWEFLDYGLAMGFCYGSVIARLIQERIRTLNSWFLRFHTGVGDGVQLRTWRQAIEVVVTPLRVFSILNVIHALLKPRFSWLSEPY